MCKCNFMWKFIVNERYQVYGLYCNCRRSAESHRNYNGTFMALLQKKAVVWSVQSDLKATGAKIIWNTSNICDPALQIDHKHLKSVDPIVLEQRDVLLSRALGGVEVSGWLEDDIAKTKKIAEENRFDYAVKAHSMNSKVHHFDEHELSFTCFQFDHILHFAMTEGHDVMNVASAINAGTLIFCMVTVGYLINPKESTEVIRATFDGFHAAFHQLYQVLKECWHYG